MSADKPNDESKQSPPSKWSRLSKYALPVALLAVIASPFVNWYNLKDFRGEVGSRLTAVEEMVKKNQRDDPASIKRLADWINKKLEVVRQVKDKLKKDKPSSSEMREMLLSLKEILRTIKSILNFFCSFGSEENRNDFQVMLDRITEELEGLSESSIESDKEGVRQKLSEIADKIQGLLEAMLKFCVFVQQSRFSTNDFDTSTAGITTHSTGRAISMSFIENSCGFGAPCAPVNSGVRHASRKERTEPRVAMLRGADSELSDAIRGGLTSDSTRPESARLSS